MSRVLAATKVCYWILRTDAGAVSVRCSALAVDGSIFCAVHRDRAAASGQLSQSDLDAAAAPRPALTAPASDVLPWPDKDEKIFAKARKDTQRR